LEDLSGIEENNLPIPNTAEWKLKTQQANKIILTTLFHKKPSPRAIKFVLQILLSLYGWKHQKAGKKYSGGEISFRQTIYGLSANDREFFIKIDRNKKKVLISFDYTKVSDKHKNWLKTVKKRINSKGLEAHSGFDNLKYKAGTKLLNNFYVQANVKKDKETKKEYYHYNKVLML